MKRKEIRICKVCGKEIDKYGSYKFGMCCKHYTQFRKYGRCLDNNPRTVYDPNEIRTVDGCGEIDTYNNLGEVEVTYKFDLEDMHFLMNHKWRTVWKGIGIDRSPYLVTGHTVYFHRLIMGNPNTEIDHINRDSRDNRKANLRESFRTQQLANTRLRIDNVEGIKGVYYLHRDNAYRAEIQIAGKHFYSKSFKMKAEAAYMRFLLEQHFYKTIDMNNNTEEMMKLIQSLSEEQKHNVQQYFVNRLKSQVVAI